MPTSSSVASRSQNLHNQLLQAAASALPNLKARAAHAREIELQALAMQTRLRRALPALQSAAEAAPKTESGKQTERQYLKCRQNLLRCEQAFQIAKTQRLTIQNMLGEHEPNPESTAGVPQLKGE